MSKHSLLMLMHSVAKIEFKRHRDGRRLYRLTRWSDSMARCEPDALPDAMRGNEEARVDVSQIFQLLVA